MNPTVLDLSREDGIRAAYAEYGAELYRYALRQLDDEGAARDVVQETFLRAWRAADRYDPSLAGLRVWLFAITRNVVIDETRRRSLRPVSPQPLEVLTALGPATAGDDDRTVTSWLIEEALQRIRPEARSALVETYLRGRPYGELAAGGVSQLTVAAPPNTEHRQVGGTPGDRGWARNRRPRRSLHQRTRAAGNR